MQKENGNYRSLILAGLGLVGQGVLRLGTPLLRSFGNVLLTDINEEVCRQISARTGYSAIPGDVTEADFINELIDQLSPPVLFVNMCGGIDTVQLRKELTNLPVAYLDTCASEMEGEQMCRFSRLMPYTNEPHHGKYPHLLCQGINPGLVEYQARSLMHSFRSEEEGFSVEIFEDDQLYSPDLEKSLAVGWAPGDLVDEVMISPTLEILDGIIEEDKQMGTRQITMYRQGEEKTVRIVGHEDIWNLGLLEPVYHARFFYRLHERVMDLMGTDPQQALDRLVPVDGSVALSGTETIQVEVQGLTSRAVCSGSWQVDHRKIQQGYGLNGVQYQTALGCLLGICLLQFTQAGQRKGTFNASTLPLKQTDFQMLERFSRKWGIHWRNQSQEGLIL